MPRDRLPGAGKHHRAHCGSATTALTCAVCSAPHMPCHMPCHGSMSTAKCVRMRPAWVACVSTVSTGQPSGPAGPPVAAGTRTRRPGLRPRSRSVPAALPPALLPGNAGMCHDGLSTINHANCTLQPGGGTRWQRARAHRQRGHENSRTGLPRFPRFAAPSLPWGCTQERQLRDGGA